jgi:hypothetical protein
MPRIRVDPDGITDARVDLPSRAVRRARRMTVGKEPPPAAWLRYGPPHVSVAEAGENGDLLLETHPRMLRP